MSRREDIDNAIWSDAEFHGLSPHAKLVYIWSFTNPRCGMAGIYKVVLGALALETGLSGSEVHGALEELREERFVFYDHDVLWVRSRVKHLRTRTNQIARSIANDLAKIPEDHELRLRFLEAYEVTPWLANALLDAVDAVPARVSLSKRREVFNRDGWKCVDCGTTECLTIDHVHPRSAGGTAELSNLATRCKGCNSRKGARSDESRRGSSRTSPTLTEGHRGSVTLQGKGKGRVKEEEQQRPVAPAREAAEFTGWLADHASVTGHTPPREGTKARAAITSAFGARRQEGYSVEDLKLATRGARANDYRRENGYDTAESVLRPTKIHDLIERGRRAGGPDRPSFEELAAAADRREREAEARRQKAGIS